MSVPNRRLASVRGVPVSSPPGRRARRSSPGTSQQPPEAREEMRRRVKNLIEGSRVMIFSKTYCPHSSRVGAGRREGRGGTEGRGGWGLGEGRGLGREGHRAWALGGA